MDENPSIVKSTPQLQLLCLIISWFLPLFTRFPFVVQSTFGHFWLDKIHPHHLQNFRSFSHEISLFILLATRTLYLVTDELLDTDTTDLRTSIGITYMYTKSWVSCTPSRDFLPRPGASLTYVAIFDKRYSIPVSLRKFSVPLYYVRLNVRFFF